MKNLIYIFIIAFICFSSCSNANEQNDPIPVHENFTIQSNVLNENRNIYVWLPENYNSTTDSFPVMYMPDGGIKEDLPHIATTLAKLIQEKKINPLILVGIENTNRKRDLTGFTVVKKDKEIAPEFGGSNQFRSFITNELFPEIQNRYRITNEKTIIGESLAGLFVMETFFYKPEMFNNYISFDPSFWWNNHDMVTNASQLITNLPNQTIRLWFAGSQAKDIQPYTKKLASILKTENPKNLIWNFSDEPKEKHNTIFRATKEKAITWTLNQ